MSGGWCLSICDEGGLPTAVICLYGNGMCDCSETIFEIMFTPIHNAEAKVTLYHRL